jgi:hypothetical protein
MDERFGKKLYCEYGVDRGLSEIVMRQRDAFLLYEVQKIHEWWQRQTLNKRNG